jgi:hypothetical protein
MARFATFAEFYPHYLAQHANRLCRRAHFLGNSSAIAALAQYADSPRPLWLLVALGSALGGAWIGHRVFEKKRPARFGHPLYSLRASALMYWQMLTGKLSW